MYFFYSTIVWLRYFIRWIPNISSYIRLLNIPWNVIKAPMHTFLLVYSFILHGTDSISITTLIHKQCLRYNSRMSVILPYYRMCPYQRQLHYVSVLKMFLSNFVMLFQPFWPFWYLFMQFSQRVSLLVSLNCYHHSPLTSYHNNINRIP